MGDWARNLDTYNDWHSETHDGEDYCENCQDWTGDEDSKCADCGLSFHEQRVFLDNTSYADQVDLLSF